MTTASKRRARYEPARSIPRATFSRLVREITDDLGRDYIKWSAKALQGLQEESELYVKEHFERAKTLSGRFNHRTVGLRHFNDGRAVSVGSVGGHQDE
jgi:histone H3/H4